MLITVMISPETAREGDSHYLFSHRRLYVPVSFANYCFLSGVIVTSHNVERRHETTDKFSSNLPKLLLYIRIYYTFNKIND